MGAFFPVITALVGAVVGAAITFWFSLSLAETNAKRFAGMKLREAFAPEIAKFAHSERVHCFLSSDILEAAFEKHQAAVDEFRFHITGKELEAFDRAWRDYYCAPDEQVDFSKYFGDDEGKKEALTRMKAIVAFTKPKGLLRRSLV